MRRSTVEEKREGIEESEKGGARTAMKKIPIPLLRSKGVRGREFRVN
jgi:hypothetical protein